MNAQLLVSVVVAACGSLLVGACEPKGQPPVQEEPRPDLVLAGPGPVSELVRQALVQAEADSRQLVVYVGASWCEPCEYFLGALRDDALPNRFDRLRFLKFDFDVDQERLDQAGYTGSMIPRFALPTSAGTASERVFEGSIKGPSAVGDLIAKLDWLLQEAPTN